MFAAISFVEYSYAYKANPTQPTLLDLSHSSPTPNYSNCTLAFNACGAQNYSSFTDPIYLIDYCGDASIYEIFSLTVGDPLFCSETEFPRAIDCKNCTCPSGQSRIDAMCVPDAALSCQQGIANYLTGECYPEECPYGDGSPEQCKQVEFCPPEESTVLLNSSCVCPVDSEWNSVMESCVEIIPNCNGENGSAIGSFFNFETDSCQCPSTSIFNSQSNVCERQHNSICDFDEYYGVDSACHKYPTGEGGGFQNTSCSNAFSAHPDPSFHAAIKQTCFQCVAAGGSPVLHPVGILYAGAGSPVTSVCPIGNCAHYYEERGFNFCFMPSMSQSLCLANSFFWDAENVLCREVPASSSSSASSNSSSNSSSTSSISSVSSSSGSASSASSSLNNNGGNNGGGSGSSSGTNNSSGGGTGGNGSGDGSGGNGTSAGSAASSGNNSSSGAGECDPEAKDYLECVAPEQSPLPSHTPTDSGFTSIDQVNQAFMNRVSNSPIVQSFQNFENIITVQNAECPVLSIDLTDVPPINSLLETDIHCQIFENIRPAISVVMFAVFAFLGFRIFASA